MIKLKRRTSLSSLRLGGLYFILSAGIGFAETLHVDHRNSVASDQNPGSAELPFQTIQAAVVKAYPGDTVAVHEGVYREHVYPVRSGSGPDQRITFAAYGDEEVVISGAEAWDTLFEPVDMEGASYQALDF